MSIRHIPVIKGGKGATVSVDTDALPEQYYEAALDSGLKVLVNGGTTKITKPADVTDVEQMNAFHAAATAKAEERVLAMMAGTLKLGRSAAVKGPSGAIMTEARRIARQLIKDTMKAQNIRVTHYAASEITKMANDLLADPEQGPLFLKQAENNLAERKSTNIKLNFAAYSEDPALVKKAEEEKLARKAGILSAAKAGKPAARVSRAVN